MASVGTIKYKNGSSWIDILHPINSFYISYASTSPSSLFGGTWVQITNAALRGATNTGYTGSDSHTLTTNEIPPHIHSFTDFYYHQYNAGGYGNQRATYSSGDIGGRYYTAQDGGAGGAHSIVQRSFNCYIWYRTA